MKKKILDFLSLWIPRAIDAGLVLTICAMLFGWTPAKTGGDLFALFIAFGLGYSAGGFLWIHRIFSEAEKPDPPGTPTDPPGIPPKDG